MDNNRSERKADQSLIGRVDFAGVKNLVLQRLEEGLPDFLTYHSVGHTEDVLHSATRIAKHEDVSAEDLTLLQTAALLHDSGFLFSTERHEEASCQYANEILPEFRYEENEIDQLCQLISATKLPQNPQSLLGEILCDADLDYLGRDDFWPISNALYKEFLYLGVVNNKNEWNKLQVKFFKSHSYFTDTAKAWRNEQKAEHLKEIRSRIKKKN
jgi:predicted metal-dependent HD superfamily phosphohydrolase